MVREFREEAEITQRRDLINSEENSNDYLKPPTGIFALKPKIPKEEITMIYFIKKSYNQAKKILTKLKKYIYEAN